MSYLISSTVDACPLCGGVVTTFSTTPKSHLGYIKNFVPFDLNKPLVPYYSEMVTTVGPCGHEVDYEFDNGTIRLKLKHPFDSSPEGQFQAFQTHLQAMATAEGWLAWFISQQCTSQLNFHFTCPHGQSYGMIESWFQTTLAPLECAKIYWQKIRGMCQCQQWSSSWTLSEYAGTAISYSYTSPQLQELPSLKPDDPTIVSHPTLGKLAKICPAIATQRGACPKCGPPNQAPLFNVVVHLNDYHKWTREAIADWLDALDVDLTVKPVEKKEDTDDKPSPSATFQESVSWQSFQYDAMQSEWEVLDGDILAGS